MIIVDKNSFDINKLKLNEENELKDWTVVDNNNPSRTAKVKAVDKNEAMDKGAFELRTHNIRVYLKEQASVGEKIRTKWGYGKITSIANGKVSVKLDNGDEKILDDNYEMTESKLDEIRVVPSADEDRKKELDTLKKMKKDVESGKAYYSLDKINKRILDLEKQLSESKIKEANDKFLLWKVPTDKDIKVGDTVAYQDEYGEYTKSGKITNIDKEGFFVVNGGAYKAKELRIKESKIKEAIESDFEKIIIFYINKINKNQNAGWDKSDVSNILNDFKDEIDPRNVASFAAGGRKYVNKKLYDMGKIDSVGRGGNEIYLISILDDVISNYDKNIYVGNNLDNLNKDVRNLGDSIKINNIDWVSNLPPSKYLDESKIKEASQFIKGLNDAKIIQLIKDASKIDSKKLQRNRDIIDKEIDIAIKQKNNDAMLDLQVKSEIYRIAFDIQEFGDTKPEDYLDNVKDVIRNYSESINKVSKNKIKESEHKSSKLKEGLNTVQMNYAKALAYYEKMKDLDFEIKNKVLKDNDFFEEGTTRRIIEPKRDYLMSDKDFENYLDLCYNEQRKKGLNFKRDEVITELARELLVDAEEALLDWGESIVAKHNDPRLPVKTFQDLRNNRVLSTRQKLVDLTMKLQESKLKETDEQNAPDKTWIDINDADKYSFAYSQGYALKEILKSMRSKGMPIEAIYFDTAKGLLKVKIRNKLHQIVTYKDKGGHLDFISIEPEGKK